MASQTLFEALSGIDNQTALAVQSLLETSAAVQEPPPADDEDVFQCGKCKKQFTSLPMFMNHKKDNCLGNISRSVNSAFTSSIQNPLNRSIQFNTAVQQSPLAQLTAQNVILSEEVLISPFGGVDHLHNNVLHANNLTGVPFVTQQTQPRNNSNQQGFTSVATINTASFASLSQNQVTFTSPGIARPTPTTAPLLSIADNTQTLVQEDLLGNQGKVPKTLNYINFVKDYNELGREKTPGTPITRVSKREGKFKCTYCEKTFPKKFDLNQHVRSHTGEKPFQCIVCGRAFAQKSNVKKHMQTHKVWPSGRGNTLPKKPISKKASKDCEEENMGQENEAVQPQPQEPVACEQLKECIVSTQQGTDAVIVDNSYLCSFCDKSFKSYFKLKTHMTQHKNEQVFKCILKSCGKTFKNLESFLEHTKTHEMEMSYRCHMCCKNFPSLYELGVHQYSHSLYPNQGPRVIQKTFRCNKCMSKYSTQAALDHHNATTNHRFDCSHCGKVFPSERNLRRHLPTHTSVGTYKCEMCEKCFKTEHYLKTHQLIHSGFKPFVCEVCSASFNRKDKLKRHMLIHNPVKRFKCPFQSVTGCKSEFNRQDKLKAHVISHSGVKPYHCPVCDKKFCRKTNLSDHMHVHTDNYPNRCDKCNKGYNRHHTCPRQKKDKITSKTDDKNIDERLEEILEVDYINNTESSLNTDTDQSGTRRSKRIKIKKRGRQQALAMKAKASQNSPKGRKAVSLTASNMIAGIARDLEIIKAHMNENQNMNDPLTAEACQDDIEQSILLTQFTESICPPSKHCNLEHSATSAFDAVIVHTTEHVNAIQNTSSS